MDEICGLKFHLSYVDISQEFFWKFLHMHTMSFLFLNLYFYQNSSFRINLIENGLRMEEFLDHYSPSFLGQNC